jgi:hypothetical protein
LLWACWGLLGTALAGQNCEPQRITAAVMARSLDLAASVAEQLDELAAADGTSVVVLARAGQDLSAYRLRYSHLGIAYRESDARSGRPVWRVVHKLNQCGSNRSALYRQGLAEFFGEGLYAYEAGVVVLSPAWQQRLAKPLADNRALSRLHEPRYNMLAYPWSGPYQQSNQWAIETLAMLVEPTVNSRAQARGWLRAFDYRPTTLHISPFKRLGARLTNAHIAFDDQPFERRLVGEIDTVTVDSVFEWLERSGFGRAPRVMRMRPLRLPHLPSTGSVLVPAPRAVGAQRI